MSAPIEIWKEYNEMVGGSWKKMPTVRYLRADLTCGECKLRCTKKCAQHGRSGDIFLNNWAISPACMAFVERKPDNKKEDTQ